MGEDPKVVGAMTNAQAGDSQLLESNTAEAQTRIDAANNFCAGCQQLNSRVESLEQQLSELLARQKLLSTQRLGTTGCYWIVIGMHGFVIMCLMASVAAILVYPFLVGAIGTLAACHSMPVRRVLMKWLRSLLSASMVCSCLLLPLSWLDALDYEFAGLLLAGLPFVFVPALMSSQMAVWTTGWRVLAPGATSSTKPRLQLFDIFGLTTIVAVYVSSFQFANVDYIDFADDPWQYLGAVWLICFLAGIGAVMCARGLLVAGPRVSLAWLVAASATIVLSTAALVGFLMVQLGPSVDDSSDLIQTLFIYIVGGSAACLASPVFTFLTMRIAGYRLASFKGS